jgi:peptidoglycan/LPS O-acetylase OafA/YrhL
MDSRINHIDGWRTISISLVIITHILVASSLRTAFTINLVGNGYGELDVDIFFVISGFVITRSLLYEYSIYSSISIYAFYIRRTFRIVPPLIIYVITIFLLSRLGILDAEASKIIRGLTFSCNFPPPISGGCGGYVGAHLWSLSFEEQFYLVLPVLLILLIRNINILTAIILLLPVATLAAKAGGAAPIGHYLNSFIFLGAGVLVSLHSRRVQEVIFRLPNYCFLIAAFIILVEENFSDTRLGSAFKVLTAAPLIVLLLWKSADINTVRRFLTSRLVVTLGRASYGIYLWQQLATNAFNSATWLFYLCSVFCCIFLSLILYRWVELPLIKFGSWRSHSIRRASIAALAGEGKFAGVEQER